MKKYEVRFCFGIAPEQELCVEIEAENKQEVLQVAMSELLDSLSVVVRATGDAEDEGTKIRVSLKGIEQGRVH
jgi:hypothetical protein